MKAQGIVKHMWGLNSCGIVFNPHTSGQSVKLRITRKQFKYPCQDSVARAITASERKLFLQSSLQMQAIYSLQVAVWFSGADQP